MRRTLLFSRGSIIGVVVMGVLVLAPPSRGDTITATGVAVVPFSNVDPSSSPVVIYAYVEAEGADANDAINKVNAKVEAVKSAAVTAGVDPSSVSISGFSVYPELEPSSDLSAPPRVVEYEAYVNFQVVVFGVNQVGAVVNAAVAAGATNVSTSLSSQASQPTTNEVAGAVAEAMEQAKTFATAAATNSQVKLGRLLSVEIKTLQPGYGPTFLVGADLVGGRSVATGGWRVEITSTYETQ